MLLADGHLKIRPLLQFRLVVKPLPKGFCLCSKGSAFAATGCCVEVAVLRLLSIERSACFSRSLEYDPSHRTLVIFKRVAKILICLLA